jgi:6-phosphogluconolactonase
MRMKLNRSSQLALVSAAGLLVSGLISACGTLTVDFVYVTSSKAAGTNNYGEVDVFEVNSESGRLRAIPTSPFPSGGRNPVAEAVGTNFSNLYVVNQDDNDVVQFAIGNDGKLYPQNTVNTPGVFPLSIAINGSFMFVADTYQPLPSCSPAEPCSGSIAVFPLSSSGAPGTPVSNPAVNSNYWPLIAPCNTADVIQPSAVTVTQSGKYVYVAAYDTTAVADNSSTDPVANTCDTSGIGTAPTGYVFAFAVGSGGALTAVQGSPFVVGSTAVVSGTTVASSVNPTALVSTPDSDYLYVTDYNNGKVYAYSVSASGGAIASLSGSPFNAGNGPAAVTVDGTGSYGYVANSLDNTLTAYSIDNGALRSFGAYPVGTQPVAALVDPSTGHFVYAASYLGGTVNGFQLIPGSSPTLYVTQSNPYTTNPQPTAMAAIPHGSTATSSAQ